MSGRRCRRLKVACARKSARDVHGFLKTIRIRCRRRHRIYLVMDNLSTHWIKDIRAGAQASNVELVPAPAYTSRLNRIECHFWATGEVRRQERRPPRQEHALQTMADYIHLRNSTHGGGPIVQLEALRRGA